MKLRPCDYCNFNPGILVVHIYCNYIVTYGSICQKGKLIYTLRLAVSGLSTGPGLLDILFILGEDEMINRIECAINRISLKKNPLQI